MVRACTPVGDDYDTLATIAFTEKGMARLAALERLKDTVDSMDDAVLSMHVWVDSADIDLRLFNGVDLEKVFDEDVCTQFEGSSFLWVEDNVDAEWESINTDGTMLIIERNVVCWSTWLPAARQKHETNVISWNDLRCPVHGWNEADEATCLLCLAEDT